MEIILQSDEKDETNENYKKYIYILERIDGEVWQNKIKIIKHLEYLEVSNRENLHKTWETTQVRSRDGGRRDFFYLLTDLLSQQSV